MRFVMESVVIGKTKSLGKLSGNQYTNSAAVSWTSSLKMKRIPRSTTGRCSSKYQIETEHGGRPSLLYGVSRRVHWQQDGTRRWPDSCVAKVRRELTKQLPLKLSTPIHCDGSGNTATTDANDHVNAYHRVGCDVGVWNELGPMGEAVHIC